MDAPCHESVEQLVQMAEERDEVTDDFTDDIRRFPSLPFERKLQVNETEYPNEVGTPTEYGCYKNGVTAKMHGRWLVINGYTSAGATVRLDYSFTFKHTADGRYLLRRVAGMDASWVSTPKGKTYHDPRARAFGAAFNQDTATQWHDSKKFCAQFFSDLDLT